FYQFASYYYLTPLSAVLTNAFPKIGHYRIKETIQVSESSTIFKKKEEILFIPLRKKVFSYLEEDNESFINPTEEQSKLIYLIIKNKNHTKPFLLFGKTGSGKTALLLLTAKRFYEEGKSVLFMVPEIGLAPHIYKRALSLFPKEDVLVWNSNLTKTERRYILERVKTTRSLLIGTRSSIFLPLKDLGLVLIDEEQDSSYKSETSFPYNSRDLAFVLSKIYKTPLILSS
ncbi:MAG: DEAD/DEAH box helicase family protein, partial [Proteobacteria bacterium]|nr:DEAD/DEAH box helicase family protein [Pseudomonadota bacterium]